MADTNKTYILNGRWTVDWPGKIQASNTTLVYQRHGDNETLTATGPTHEDLNVMVGGQLTRGQHIIKGDVCRLFGVMLQ